MIDIIKTLSSMEKTSTKNGSSTINKYSIPASDERIQKTMEALRRNGINSVVFDSAEEVKKMVFELIPEGAEVMDMTSVTLKALGIADEITNSGKYNSLRKKLHLMDQKTKRKRGSVADFAIGSMHAVTLNGEILIASATGSQLAAYAYGSQKVILVAGTQKIVTNYDEGMKRLYEYCLPLEDERAQKAYNSHSKVAKILTINSDNQDRFTVIFIRQTLGF